MTFPPRTITILSLVQFFFVCAGFLITHAMLHLYRKYWGEFPGLGIPYFLQFISSFGLCFLFVPAIWFSAAIIRRNGPDGVGTISSMQFIFGIVLTITVSLLFSVAAMASLLFYFRSWR